MAALIDRFAGRGYSDIKRELTVAVQAFLGPIRARRAELLRGERELRESIHRQSQLIELGAAVVATKVGFGAAQHAA